MKKFLTNRELLDLGIITGFKVDKDNKKWLERRSPVYIENNQHGYYQEFKGMADSIRLINESGRDVFNQIIDSLKS